MQSIRRGDIYYVANPNSTGSEQRGTRPAVIVSNELANRHSSVVEVVFLTTRSKTNLPTHIPVCSNGRPSTALCEQITSVDVSRIGTYEGALSPEEMRRIDRGLSISLGILQ